MEDKVILDGVLAEFSKLAEIPRQSQHEQQVSDYLADRLRKMGLSVVQDAHNNVIADKAAVAGYEDAPLIMLQGHMDMVCVAEKGRAYDPVKDSIKLINDGKFLRADGTSLGADDGIGIAIVLYILENKLVHGPLRIIFTTDEERGMTGAKNLDNKYIKDVKYLINCDSEEYDVVTIGSAGSMRMLFSKGFSWEEATEKVGLEIEVKNLLGGHSGMVINENRANAIKILALILRRLQEQDIYFEVSNIEGGVADNAVAPHAQVNINCSSKDKDEIKTLIDNITGELREAYHGIEKDLLVLVKEVPAGAKVLPQKASTDMVLLLNSLHSGVYAMSQLSPVLPELSANIGKIEINGAEVSISVLPRAATNASLSIIKTSYGSLAQGFGFKLNISATSPAWNGNPQSPLVEMAKSIFKDLTGIDMKVESSHGGLECNHFINKNPHIDAISIGPNNLDIHSPQEKLELATIVPQVKLLQKLVEGLAENA